MVSAGSFDPSGEKTLPRRPPAGTSHTVARLLNCGKLIITRSGHFQSPGHRRKNATYPEWNRYQCGRTGLSEDSPMVHTGLTVPSYTLCYSSVRLSWGKVPRATQIRCVASERDTFANGLA